MSKFSVASSYRSHYQGFYDGPSAWRRLCALDKAKNIVDLCEPFPHESVLEIGAGDGSVLRRLSELGFGARLSALEISETALAAIEAQGIDRLAESRQFDGYSVPFEDGAFDLAILSHVLEHVEYPRRLLYEAGRVARHVFVEVPLEHNVRLPWDYVADDVGHINFYCPRTIRRLVQTCDLEPVHQVLTHPSPEVYRYRHGAKGRPIYWIKELTRRWTPWLAPCLWVNHAALICRRGATPGSSGRSPS